MLLQLCNTAIMVLQILTACWYADIHNFSVWGFCDSEKKDERYAVPSTVHEIPSLASSCTASLAYATPCLMFSKRCSADATSSCLSIIDKLRSETLLLACTQRWKNFFLQMSILSQNYVRKLSHVTTNTDIRIIHNKTNSLPAHTDGKFGFFSWVHFPATMPEKLSHVFINMDIRIINTVTWWHNRERIKFWKYWFHSV